jgi:hypothetical protein
MLDQLINGGQSGAAASGLSQAGDLGMAEVEALNKSLSAGYESDMNGMAGGSALRIQSLDTNLQATVQDNKHFALFNALPKPRATAVLDEWTEQHSIGGFFGGTFNDQDGIAMETQGDYTRMVGRVKYMSTYRKVPIVLQQQNNLADVITLETTNGTKQLLTDIEVGLFEGRDDVTPKAFAGIRQQLESLNSTDNIIDMAGQALSNIDPIAKAAQNIFGFGNFGRATDIYVPPSVQTDLNMDLDPAFRVMLNANASSTVRGTHVAGVQTSYGQIATQTDVFIRDEKLKMPFESRNALHAAVAAANSAFKPQSVAAVAGAGGADSMWTSANAGNYYWSVTGINQNGESQSVQTAQTAVASGQQVTLTITGSAGGTETGYVIYRSRLNGTNALTDLREMIRVPKSGATTTYIDKNREIPGSTCAFVLNMTASDHAIAWRQFMPMMKIAMAATNSPIIPWLQMICGYLRITKRNQHCMIKNIVTNSQAWRPFN